MQLLHLADSALPIGAMAHSLGVETLIAEAGLDPSGLPVFFEDWLSGTGRSEAMFCLEAHAIVCQERWTMLNARLTSFKVARESREASLRLGRRFITLAAGLTTDPRIAFYGDAHLATAFGLVSGVLGMEARTAAAAHLHQGLYGAVSACQRLLSFGQSAATKLLWSLKPRILEIVEEAARQQSGQQQSGRPQFAPLECEGLWTIQPMLEIASMRHPRLSTRLFIS